MSASERTVAGGQPAPAGVSSPGNAGLRAAVSEVHWFDALCVAVAIALLWQVAGMMAFFVAGFFILVAERLFPIRRQPFFRPAWGTDLAHAVFTSTMAALLTFGFVFAAGKSFHAFGNAFLSPFHAQPMALQVLEALLLIDLGRYWEHRLRHAIPLLWRFHAIHHSAEDPDWMTAKRGHPVDGALRTVAEYTPLYVLGTPTQLVVLFFLLTKIFDMWSHANVRFSLGPFWWLIQTPEFHRIHHEKGRTSSQSNFSGLFPFFDVIFGTSMMVRKRSNVKYGLPYRISMRYIDHFVRPFLGDGVPPPRGAPARAQVASQETTG